MLLIDHDTLTITCPQGDTGLITLNLIDGEGQVISDPITGVGIFAVCQKIGSVYNTIAFKYVNIVNNTVTFRINNAFSRNIPEGIYYWDVRIVTDPEYDVNSNVICEDDSDDVHSLYAARSDGMPRYIVKGVAVNV